METWLIRMCRRSAARQLQVWGLIVVAVIVVVALNWRYAMSFVEGPHSETAESLGKIANTASPPHDLVSIAGSQLGDTGIQETTTETENGVQTNRYVSAEYYAMLLGNRILIVKDSSKPPLTVEGTIQPIPPEVYSELFSDFKGGEYSPQAQKFKETLYPFYLTQETTSDFRTPGYIAIGVGLVLLLLLYKFARPAWTRLKDVSRHPVYKRVCAWGDPTVVSADIENEFDNRVRLKYAGTRLTEKYFIQNSWLGFNVLRIESLLWAYEKVTQRRVNFIPTGKTYEAVLVCNDGTATVQSSKKNVEEILSFAAQRVPWAVLGHTKQLQELFSKHAKEFRAAVEERRKDYLKTA